MFGMAAGRTLPLLIAAYLAVFVVTMLIAIGLLATLPPTYFRDGGRSPAPGHEGAKGTVARIVRNAVGTVLILLGILLSLPAVPGQGVLTMLIGLLLVDFPGKRRLEQRLVARRGVLDALNRLRAWCGRPPFER